MSLARLLVYCSALLFGVIFIMAFFKEGDDKKLPTPAVSNLALEDSLPTSSSKNKAGTTSAVVTSQSRQPVEIPIERAQTRPAVSAAQPKSEQNAQAKNSANPEITKKTSATLPSLSDKSYSKLDEKSNSTQFASTFAKSDARLDPKTYPENNVVDQLFNKKGSTLKFVETLTYKSRVGWLKGRPAWLSDYASHYETSRHFIARSLNGNPQGLASPSVDYFKQDIAEGDRFNVFKEGVALRFHLIVDASICKMWLYAIDETHQEKTLLKTYTVCLGRPDPSRTSGLLTPFGKYSLGNRIAIYKPKVMGYHNAKKIEMVRVFGSRWIPFEKEIADATAPAKGFGIHGVPWTDTNKGELSQDKSSLGKYESDGCVRLSTEDMEELFSIIITKPTEIEIVRNFKEASINK